MNLAREAYEAYANRLGYELPRWGDVTEVNRQAWIVAAAWVAGKVSGNHDWQIPVKDAAIADKIKATAMTGDREHDHATADELLCELLLSIGCEKSVEAWRKVGKWYA